VARVARERGVSENEIRRIVAKHTEGRQFGFLGEARVNVLELNLDLDDRVPKRSAFLDAIQRKDAETQGRKEER
jgi:K+-transporting ATPase ATPase C chain